MEPVEEQLLKLVDINQLMEGGLTRLSQKELTQLHRLIDCRLDMLEDERWQQLVKRIDEMLQPKTKNTVWERNHSKIQGTIAGFIKQHSRMPNKKELAEYAGLSRYTVHKHFKEYVSSMNLEDQKEHYQLSVNLVVDSLLKAALNGNVKAGITYLQLMGKMPGGNTIIQTPNNIQLNKTVINQQTIQQLKPEQLQQIEQIINDTQPKPEEEPLQQPTLQQPLPIARLCAGLHLQSGCLQ
ncbi:MAG: hypothetical protein U0V74_07920 [Chitinophagales bacterium]